MHELRSVFAVAGIAILSGADFVTAPVCAEPEPRIEGQGAAGVVEVGRPLDVVRGRAEALARARAVDALVSSAKLLASGQDLDHTEGRGAGDIGDEARARAGASTALWQLRYWSNGAVTAQVAVSRDEIFGEVTEGD